MLILSKVLYYPLHMIMRHLYHNRCRCHGYELYCNIAAYVDTDISFELKLYEDKLNEIQISLDIT